ncbi:MAG TPA: cysteine desulfurase [Anaerolineae bacterium]|nr:cysteine desulfurase [Anaerolineae bacterium]HID84251.1 cysteine desulfurase [Anaerolineales bacterium]
MPKPDFSAILDVPRIRQDFPVLQREVRPGVPLVYLDSTATSQKPRQVVEAVADFYLHHNANIHRGIHTLAEEATAAYEEARAKVARFINAASPREIVFVRNATEAINLVAYAWGRANLQPGDVVLLTEMEHHANLVPWQILAAERDIRLEFMPVTPEGLLDLDALPRLLAMEPKMVAFSGMSNVTGVITPAAEITRQAHEAGAVVLLDGAQLVPHVPVDVQALGVDFMAFSGHKMLGPTGVGVLYGRRDLLETMPPFLGGGDMIRRVELRSFVANEVPHKFEAGTPPIAEAVGLGAAIDYLNAIGMDKIAAYEHAIGAYALERLREVPGLRIFGPDIEHKGAVFAFWLEEAHPHDVAQVLDYYGIAVRAGHHCAQPLHAQFRVLATARASFYLYNTPEEVDKLMDALYKVKEMFG